MDIPRIRSGVGSGSYEVPVGSVARILELDIRDPDIVRYIGGCPRNSYTGSPIGSREGSSECIPSDTWSCVIERYGSSSGSGIDPGDIGCAKLYLLDSARE